MEGSSKNNGNVFPIAYAWKKPVHTKAAQGSLSLPIPTTSGFYTSVSSSAFSSSYLTHTDAGDDVIYQAQSLSHPFDFTPSF